MLTEEFLTEFEEFKKTAYYRERFRKLDEKVFDEEVAAFKFMKYTYPHLSNEERGVIDRWRIRAERHEDLTQDIVKLQNELRDK